MTRIRSLLLGGPMLDSDLFDAAAIDRLLSEHEGGKVNHAQPIWLLLTFEGFLANFWAAPPAPANQPDAARQAA
jgi:asparagine synthase (glutamine-hydrolysing)